VEFTQELSSSSVLFCSVLSFSLYSHYIHNLPSRMSECGSCLHSVLGRTGLGIVLGIVLFFSELVGLISRCCCCSALLWIVFSAAAVAGGTLCPVENKTDSLRTLLCFLLLLLLDCAFAANAKEFVCESVPLASSTAKLLCMVISSILEE